MDIKIKIKMIMIIFMLVFLGNVSSPLKIKAETGLYPDGVAARAAVLMDAETGIVIYDKDMHERLYPASITKLMTVLLALEYADETEGAFEERVYFSYEAVYSLPYDSSGIAMDEGESLSFEQALYAVMLPSANEVANAVAEHIAGTAEEFAAMMTERAVELGAYDTNFKNPHGLHDEDHYTTPYDMAIIMRELIKHPFFLTLISTAYYEIPPTEKTEETREMYNSNKMIQPGDYYREEVVGGKTGFTTPAGHTLVTYAEKDDIKLITAVMKCEKNVIYTDTAALLDYGFGMFKEFDIAAIYKESYPPARTLPVFQKYRGRTVGLGFVEIVPAGILKAVLPKNIDVKSIVFEEKIPKSLEAPVGKGRKIGSVTASVNGFTLGEIDIEARRDVFPEDVLTLEYEEKSANFKEAALVVFSALKTMMILFALIVIAAFSIRKINIYKRRKRRRMLSQY